MIGFALFFTVPTCIWVPVGIHALIRRGQAGQVQENPRIRELKCRNPKLPGMKPLLISILAIFSIAGTLTYLKTRPGGSYENPLRAPGKTYQEGNGQVYTGIKDEPAAEPAPTPWRRSTGADDTCDALKWMSEGHKGLPPIGYAGRSDADADLPKWDSDKMGRPDIRM
jgi:hypothetical protein